MALVAADLNDRILIMAGGPEPFMQQEIVPGFMADYATFARRGFGMAPDTVPWIPS